MKNRRKRIELAAAIVGFLILLSIKPEAIAESTTRPETEPAAGAMGTGAFPLEVELVPSNGYRVDELDWNIAGNASGSNPNVLSELTWDDLQIYQMKIQGNLVLPNIIALKGAAGYGWIFDGDNQDSDYSGNSRTLEWSRSENNADDGHVLDLSAAIGYPVRFGRSVLTTITPLVGYSYHEQHLKVTDGFQTVSEPSISPPGISPLPVGPFDDLDSTYETEWKGPWIGFDIRFKAREIRTFAHRFEPYFSYEYHWADYYAEANWNLRQDFAHPKSFEHEADGNGYVIGVGFNIRLQRHVALNLNFDYQDWSTDEGTDRVFFSSGTITETQLNEVNWTSYALSLGLSLCF
jgi:hypothetical protein